MRRIEAEIDAKNWSRNWCKKLKQKLMQRTEAEIDAKNWSRNWCKELKQKLMQRIEAEIDAKNLSSTSKAPRNNTESIQIKNQFFKKLKIIEIKFLVPSLLSQQVNMLSKYRWRATFVYSFIYASNTSNNTLSIFFCGQPELI